MMSIGPGWALAQLTPDQPLLIFSFIGGSVLIAFPIIVLSQLHIGSMFGILSFRVLESWLRCPLSWLMFYVETGALIGGCLAMSYFVHPILCTPVYVMSALLYARLLGRLGWQLADKMAIEAQ
jgi:hypothetical protein